MRELNIAGCSCTDAGLQALAALPIERLMLVDCDSVRGETLSALPHVRELAVRGGQLGQAASARLPSLLRARIPSQCGDGTPQQPIALARGLA